jgi:hypothetical protein
MTEQEWLMCNEPEKMLLFLLGKVSERKLRLFAAASFQNLTALLSDSRQLRAITMLEQAGEGTITQEEWRDLTTSVRHALPAPSENPFSGEAPSNDPYFVALMLYREIVCSRPAVHAILAPAGLADGATEQKRQIWILHDIFGNPFRPVAPDPSWLTPTVKALAQGIYDERRWEDLPFLADALEEAGCDHADVLEHSRSGGVHVRGCWLLDLLLGKE